MQNPLKCPEKLLNPGNKAKDREIHKKFKIRVDKRAKQWYHIGA